LFYSRANNRSFCRGARMFYIENWLTSAFVLMQQIRHNERSSNRVKKMSDKAKMNRDRVANFRNRKIAAGLKELKIWVKPEHAEQIKSFAKSLGE